VSARTFGQMSLRDYGGGSADRWILARLEPHVIIRLKALFPSIPKAAAPPYQLVADGMTSADLEWFISRYPLDMCPADVRELAARRRAFDANQAEMERILSPDYQPPLMSGLRAGQIIRPYQQQAIELLARAGGLLCGDEVGLGKTYTAVGACLSQGALPATVVCHPHLQRQWVDVIEAVTNLKAHAVRSTKPYPLPPADVRVFRYSQLLGWADMFERLGAGLVVFDEVQELRTGTDSGKGQAAMRLARTAAQRLGLSATPIYNYGREVYTILSYLRPDALGEYGSFAREWAPNGPIKDPRALGSYLREKHAFIRRTKHDVGQDMPAVNRIVDVVDYDVATLASIEETARALALKATTGQFTERGQAARDLDLLVRQQTGIAKAKAVAAVVRILVEGGEPIVLVGWHREVYDQWLEALKDLRPAMYTGSETAAQKAMNAAAFMNGDTDVLIMSLRSGAGLNGLQFRCSTMVFGELDWSPGVHHQCIGRLDREGQTAPVTALFLVAEEGSDPPLMEVLGLKASEAAQIVDPSMGVQQQHSDRSVLQRLVQQYLNKAGATHAVRREAAGA
jgi:SNF2-related domain